MFLLHFLAGDGQMVQMDSTKSGFVGSEVELRCIFINSNPPVKISQVTWQKVLNSTKHNVAIANPALGAAVRHRTPSLEDTTIVFSNLQLSDEAAYICEYTTFPAGNRENMVNLTVYGKGSVTRAQKRKTTVATCVSANGKPPSLIRWDTRLKGEATFQETRNQNGTVTVRSNYMVIPSRETHKQKLTCIVSYRGDQIKDSVVLNVQYEPEVKIEGFDGNWYLNRPNVQLTCRANANPLSPSTSGSCNLNGSLPSNVEIKNNTLFFKGPVSYDLAGTYVCDATNGIGTRTGIVESTSQVNRMSAGLVGRRALSPAPSAVVGSVTSPREPLVLLGLAAILLFVFLRRRQRTFKGDYSTKKHVFGNGYSKNLQYPDDSDDEKKSAQIGVTGSVRDFDTDGEDLKRPYFTVDEGESRDYDGRTLSFQYDPEPELADDMISQTDGSVISKKEWYV
uniref:Nectin cell adhesion molecule 1b n=1 Tax=Neogobius melanostomus TaxID=47308 RepID=A0A8C6S2C3_9GOBI